MVRWQDGRQVTGYKKLLLAQVGHFFDVYLIDYPEGSSIPEHTDLIPGRSHYRLNIRLRGADTFRGRAIARFGRVIFFRSDRSHRVEAHFRRRTVLSFGFSMKDTWRWS